MLLRPEDLTNEPKAVDFITENTSSLSEAFRPFISDPEKQQRYEKYLHFVKIGAKGLSYVLLLLLLLLQ